MRGRAERLRRAAPRHRARRATGVSPCTAATAVSVAFLTGGALTGAMTRVDTAQVSEAPVALGQARGPSERLPSMPAQSIEPSQLMEREEQVAAVPRTGSGKFQVATAADPPSVGDLLYSVEVEKPLPFATADVARVVDTTLADSRSWGDRLGLTLRRVDERPSVRVLLATPATTDALCAPLDTAGRVSCRNGSLVVLNAVRWASAVPWYADDVALYRTYLVNHEVGHALGRSHEQCPGPGSPAPVMQQQTYGLAGCRRSGWPSPAELD